MPYVVHGVVAAEAVAALELPALSNELATTLEVVEHRGVAALVSATDESELDPSRANLMTHTRVLEELGDRTTVVPMTFGVLVPDRERLVADFLEPQHGDLMERIRRLEGCVELRLRGRYDEREVLREVVTGDRKVERLRGQQDLDSKLELGRRVTAGIEARREHDAARAVDALGPVADDVAAAAVAAPLDAFSVSFLVERERLGSFDDAVDRLGDELSPLIALELVGPLPPFSFTSTAV